MISRFLQFSPLLEQAGEGTGGGGGDQQQQQQQTETAEQKIARLERELGDEKKGRETAEGKAREFEQSSQYHFAEAQKLRGNGRDGAGKPEDREDDDNTDILELAGKGPKAVLEWMKSKGFVNKGDVDTMVQARANQMMREAELVRTYPDLSDHESEFFKETAKEYGNLKAQGVPEAMAMELAAERVGMRRGRGEGAGSPSKPGKPGTGAGGRDDERAQRARAQAGEGTRRQPARKDDDAEDELSQEQLQICEKLGVSPDAYKKRAKEGVQYAR